MEAKEEDKVEEKPEAIDDEQTIIRGMNKKAFEQIKSTMRANDFGTKILASIDFKALLDNLLSYLCLIIQKRDKLQAEESAIIGSCLNLLKTLLICDENLINKFYDWTRPDLDKHYATVQQQYMDNQVKNGTDLFMQGIITGVESDRIAF